MVFLFLWVAQPSFATTSDSKTSTTKKTHTKTHSIKTTKTTHSNKKKTQKSHKKITHKKTLHKKHSKVHKQKRIIKPNIVKKKDIPSFENSVPHHEEAVATPSPVSTTTSPSSYRVLTQPMASTPTPAMASTPAPTSTPMHSFFHIEHKTSFAASIEQRLVNFVHKSVASLRYSTYKLGGSHIDTSQGIYIVDCSGYVDHTLRVVYPNAYLSLVGSSGVDKPNTSHYYNFFNSLPSDPDQFWSKVEDIEQLRPGDILVFRYKNMRGHSAGGHVMVVMNKPERDGDAYLVSVTDSAASGHSEDTRQNHVSGVGIGTILLKINPKTRQPSAYAWTVNSRWKNNVNFAMARPLEMDA